MQEIEEQTPASWQDTMRDLMNPSVSIMLFLGFSAGLPILLIFSSLSLWLGEAGVEKKAVTFFSWAALGYSFKFIWAPLIDKLPLPWLTRQLGRRRSWLLVAQVAVIGAIVWMGSTNPANGIDSLTFMAYAAVLLGFSSATQDIVIDAYRIEIAEPRLQALLSSTYIVGYRIAMLIAGAGTLFIASTLGTETDNYLYSAWQWAYYAMAGFMLLGVLTTLFIPEPVNPQKTKYSYATSDYLRLVAMFVLVVAAFVTAFFFSNRDFFAPLKAAWGDTALGNFVLEVLHFALAIAVAFLAGFLLVKLRLINKAMAYETWIAPIVEFFQRYGLRTALLLLALVGFYRISDIVLGVISNVFYQDMDFTKPEIATAVKTFGLFMTIFGGIFGGILAVRFGVMRMLLWGAILSACTNLLFILLAQVGHQLPMLYLVVAADNLAAGLASAAFIAFLSALTNISFTAVQYAIFSSLMTLLPKVTGGYSGSIVDNIGYTGFFTFTTLVGIPVIYLVIRAGKELKVHDQAQAAAQN